MGIMEVLCQECAKNCGICFLLVLLVDMGSSEIFLEGAMHKTVECFTILIRSTLNNQSGLFLDKIEKTFRLGPVFCPFSYQILEKVFDLAQEELGWDVAGDIFFAIAIVAFPFLGTFMQNKTQVCHTCILILLA